MRPSGSRRLFSPPVSAGSRGTISRASSLEAFHGPSGSRMRMLKRRPSPSMSSRTRLCAGGIHTRADIKDAAVEAARDVGVEAVAVQQLVDEIEAGAGARELGRVDITVDPEGGFVAVIAVRERGDGGEPDVTTHKAQAKAHEPHQGRVALGECVQQRGERRVTVITVKTDIRHGDPPSRYG